MEKIGGHESPWYEQRAHRMPSTVTDRRCTKLIHSKVLEYEGKVLMFQRAKERELYYWYSFYTENKNEKLAIV